ncbi:MAG: FtsX-like permease family protein [Bacteroidales bacterium]
MKQVFLQLFKKGNNSITKIFLLGLGLAMGLVLIAKVYYEKVYDNFMPDAGRVYIVLSDYSKLDKQSSKIFPQTPGAIAPGIKACSPMVEAATRCTGFASDVICSLVDKNGNLTTGKYSARNINLADSSFFEIFTRKITGNNPKEGLNIKNHIYISRSYAKILATEGNTANVDALIGSVISPMYVGNGTLKFTIDGIFEDFPTNSSFGETDILLSLPSIGQFMYDGTNNWVGNDRYRSFVKLLPGSSVKDIEAGIATMCKKNLPLEELEKSGVKISFHIEPLSTYHTKGEENSAVGATCMMLLILSAIVLIVSILNYVLIALSAMVHKAKMVAVHKCFGAYPINIYKMVFSEACIHLLISIILACFLILAFKNSVEEVIGSSLKSLISPESIVILIAICVVICILCGLLPGMVYSKIPVAAAFRRYKESSRKWKVSLLFVQFVASTFFVSLLAVVIMQYNYMINSNPGYAYKNVLIVNLGTAYHGKKETIKNELSSLSAVEMISSCYNPPIYRPSGNNVYLPGDDKEYFNIADMYFASDGYFKLMEIPIIEGRNFTEEANVTNEIMVSRSFVKKMETMAGWKDGAIGKNVLISEHSQMPTDIFTICGVYEDYLIGDYEVKDTRPSVQFYGGKTMENEDSYRDTDWLIIKLKEINPQNITAVEKIINKANPDGGATVIPYANEVVDAYKESRRFKAAVTYAGAIVLLITLMGLLGYTQDEINRRRSEIAVRKINGATIPELLKLFLNNVLKLALPATIVGSVGAYFAAGIMLENYTKQITLSWWIFTLCCLAILMLISAIVTIRTYNAANANPVENLKSE